MTSLLRSFGISLEWGRNWESVLSRIDRDRRQLRLEVTVILHNNAVSSGVRLTCVRSSWLQLNIAIVKASYRLIRCLFELGVGGRVRVCGNGRRIVYIVNDWKTRCLRQNSSLFRFVSMDKLTTEYYR